MNVLLTGATGFIGRSLISSLMAAGENVTAVVRRSDHGLPCSVVVAGESLDMAPYEKAMKGARVDAVVNLLAAGVDPTDREQERLVAANTSFPFRLVRTAAQAGVGAFVHIGTSAEYAPLDAAAPLAESAPLERQRLYGATKAAGSILVQMSAHQFGLSAAVLRAFNIFGPGERPYRLFPAAAAKLARREAIPLSNGTQTRDFLYVDDACNAIGRMIRALTDGVAEPGEYNLASGRPVTVREFAETLADLLGADAGLLSFGAVPMRPDEIPYVVADTSKLDLAIGPACTVDLRAALRRGIHELGLERSR